MSDGRFGDIFATHFPIAAVRADCEPATIHFYKLFQDCEPKPPGNIASSSAIVRLHGPINRRLVSCEKSTCSAQRPVYPLTAI